MGRLLCLLALFAAVSAAHAAEPSAPAFLVQATGAIKFEIASSQLATRKTKSAAVLGFAHQMILDGTAASMKLRQTIADAKLPTPRDVYDDGHKALWDTLSHTPPGKPFATAYLEAQDKALRDDLALFEAYARDGDNERLKFFAGEMVPIVRGQLDQLGKVKLHK
jgi:putative membrane protein